MKNIYLAALAKIPGIGHVRLRNVVNHFGGVDQVWQASKSDLLASGFLDEGLCNNVVSTREKLDIDKLASQWEKLGIRIVGLWDEDYPALLAATYNPPTLLYYRGILPQDENLIAIVGSRRATAYGRNVCQMLATELVEAGVGIVSGAARGIDASAHQGALEQGYTIAVLGNGVDISYPAENARLLARIAETGAIVSEYAPGTMPQAGQFPARNRIINGLARGVIVVEAAERSGALITADFALEEGRDVFAVPGSIMSQASRGTHRLIKQGAKLVDCAADILEEYGWVQQAKRESCQPLSKEEQAILKVLSADVPTTLDEIIVRTNLPVPTVTYTLMQLEFQGLATEYGGQRYLQTAKGGTR